MWVLIVSTGKTEFATMLSQKLDIPYQPSVARKIKARGFEINRKASMLDQNMILITKQANEVADRHFVSDRSLIDSLAYANYSVNFDWKEANRFAYITLVEEFVENNLHYDKLVYFPIYWPLVSDGTRDNSEEYRTVIDNIIKQYLTYYNVNVITVPNFPTEDRVDWFISRHLG